MRAFGGLAKAAGGGKSKRKRPFWVELPLLLVMALGLTFLVKNFLVEPYVIPSESMERTMQVGDRVVVNKTAHWLGEPIRRGQVIVFRDPGDWVGETQSSPGPLMGVVQRGLALIRLMPGENERFLTKRVIGLPGDRITCDGQGAVKVNGVPLEESSYLYPNDEPSTTPFDVTVPAGRLWVMGDHRSDSADSRAHQDQDGGTIAVDSVVGPAVAVVWHDGLPAWDPLRVPSTLDQPALEAGRGVLRH